MLQWSESDLFVVTAIGIPVIAMRRRIEHHTDHTEKRRVGNRSRREQEADFN
jgi:hypothetical protein